MGPFGSKIRKIRIGNFTAVSLKARFEDFSNYCIDGIRKIIGISFIQKISPNFKRSENLKLPLLFASLLSLKCAVEKSSIKNLVNLEVSRY